MDKNFGSMPLGKKVEYLWMYYKIWLVILAVVIGVIYLGCTMYKGRHTTVLLNVAVTGGDSQKAEELNKDFCKYAGIDEKDGIIRIQANIPEDNTLKKKKIISYDDAHAAIMVNAQNQKMAEKFISYLEQLNHINNAN